MAVLSINKAQHRRSCIVVPGTYKHPKALGNTRPFHTSQLLQSTLHSQQSISFSDRPAIDAILKTLLNANSNSTTTANMVHQAMPLAHRNQTTDDHHQARKHTPMAEEQLPAYSDAADGRAPAYVDEKQTSRQQSERSKGSGRMATIRSILTGDVHKHNPRYVLEESMTGQSTRSLASTPKATGSKSSPSTLKSILTGDVHKHHPMYRLEESADQKMRT
ncbi:hypothetical protein LTR53_000598 [Teratosphaeriaceae sp. CCFEE 6253]|nr:hypothetical protein LTR53_000598 [Teratosphaeriaceae sp. CCFEE 6253]